MNDIQKRVMFSHKVMKINDINLLSEVIKTNLKLLIVQSEKYKTEDYCKLDELTTELLNKKMRLINERLIEREAIN